MRKALFLLVSLILIPTITLAAGRTGKRVKPTKIPIIKSIPMNPERIVVLRGEVNEYSGADVVAKLTELDLKSNEDIFLILNTPGGSVPDGQSIITAIVSIKSPVICVIDTEAYSMGAIIASYCRKVYIHKNASIMFHEASFTIKGTESINKSRMKFITKYLDDMHRETAAVLDLPVEEYKAKLIREWWMGANQAVLEGVADVVIEELVYQFDPPEERGLLFGSLPNRPDWLKDVDIRM